MSLNDFNRRARLTISVSINGVGQFLPWTGNRGNWTLAGTVTAEEPTISLTAREETCGLPFESPKEFRTFLMPGSTGNTSGSISTGQLPQGYDVLALLQETRLGEWTVNTSPELSTGGMADGELVQFGYYVVALPENTTPDDPIIIDPPIDTLTRVYPGDAVYVAGTGEYAEWRVAPQRRYPQPDRTFFWQANTSPALASGGLVDGELALPGTIAIPAADYYIEPPAEAIDGMRYFFGGIGIKFDGQTWRSQYPQPIIYVPEDGPKEARILDLNFVSPERYQSLLEFEQRQKSFLFTNQTINDQVPVLFVYTPEQGNAEQTELYFRWVNPANGVPTNIQPVNNPIHNFGDAWSAHHLATKEWLRTRFPGLLTATFNLTPQDPENPVTFNLTVDAFEDGNVTEFTQTVEIDGEQLTNNVTITLTVSTALA